MGRPPAIQPGPLPGVAHVEPGELDCVPDRQFEMLPGVPCGDRRSPRHHRIGGPLMIDDVLVGQTRPLVAMPRVHAFVCGQVPAV